MKTKFTNIIAIAALTLSTAFISACNSPAEKLENAQEDVQEANERLDEAEEEYLRDIENYRMETADKIADNDSILADFREKIKTEKEEDREYYQKQIDDLERRNNEMRIRMDEYKGEGEDKWQQFKTEFSHDMKELGEAFKNLGVKNTDDDSK